MAPDRRPPVPRTPMQSAFDTLTFRTLAIVLALVIVATIWLGPTTAMARIAGAL